MATRKQMRRSNARAFLVVACGALALSAAACGEVTADGGDIGVTDLVEQSLTEGGPNPAAQTVQITNRGDCTLDLAVASITIDGAAWLSATPRAVQVPPAASAGITVSFQAVTTGLLPGNYVGSIELSGTCVSTGQAARGSPRLVPVNMRVTSLSASIAAKPDSIAVDVAPLRDVWAPIEENLLVSGRSSHTAIWTGREMWTFGGLDTTTSTLGVGAKYDPLLDDWSTMPSGANAPDHRYLHTAVWTGSEMIVWGGRTGLNSTTVTSTGARLGNTWTPTSAVNAPAARSGHTAVWTGTEMIVFGGFDTTLALGSGARYSPATDTWQTVASGANAPSPRANHAAVWTGTRMLVWGGENASGFMRSDGASYDPATNRWQPLAPGGPVRSFLISAWTGSRWLLYGGADGATTFSDGMMYAPDSDSWSAIPADTQRRSDFTSAAWTGAELIVWGGTSGRRFNPTTNVWTDVTATGQPSARQAQSGVWTGNAMILYGGVGGTGTDGYIYR